MSLFAPSIKHPITVRLKQGVFSVQVHFGFHPTPVVDCFS